MMGCFKKYELVKEDRMTIIIGHSEIEVYRIRALRDFGNVKKGDIGGFVQSEYNLSQYGDCWIYGDAMCWQRGKVLNNAKLKALSEVLGTAKIRDNAIVTGCCIIKGSSIIGGDVELCGGITTIGTSKIYGKGLVTGEYVFNNDLNVTKNINKYHELKL